MKRIAITGGIGSGKSIACAYLEEKGYRVIYADRIARGLTAAGGAAIPYIIENFGQEYIDQDGSMNRKKMRDLVMHDKKALETLQDGTSRIAKEIIDRELRDCDDIVFIEIPLLYEMNAQDEYDEVWLITADLETRIDRIISRDGVSRDAAMSVINNQIDDEIKRKSADVVIENNGNINNLKQMLDFNISSMYNR